MKIALYIWACFQALFFGVSVFAFRPGRANALLSAFYILSATLMGVQYLLRFGGYLYTHGEIAFISDAINLSFGPVVYLYLNQVLIRKLPPRAYLHALLPIAFVATYWYLLLTRWQPFTYDKYIGQPFHVAVLATIALSYSLYAYRYNHLLTRFQQGQPAYRREVRNWLYIFLAFFLLKAMAAYIVLLRHWLPIALRTSIHVQEITFLVIDSVIILASGVLVFRQADVLDMERVDLFMQAIMPRKKKAAMNEEDTTERVEALNRLMNTDRLYTQPGLNEKSLAEALNLQSYQLSALLNDHLGKSFSEFINEHRIREAQRRLLDPQTANDTMFAIALDCGYNSEPVFYTNFKKHTGTTPKRFQADAVKKRANSPTA
jgi:AraC-like DNA-binding protein